MTRPYSTVIVSAGFAGALEEARELGGQILQECHRHDQSADRVENGDAEARQNERFAIRIVPKGRRIGIAQGPSPDMRRPSTVSEFADEIGTAEVYTLTDKLDRLIDHKLSTLLERVNAAAGAYWTLVCSRHAVALGYKDPKDRVHWAVVSPRNARTDAEEHSCYAIHRASERLVREILVEAEEEAARAAARDERRAADEAERADAERIATEARVEAKHAQLGEPPDEPAPAAPLPSEPVVRDLDEDDGVGLHLPGDPEAEHDALDEHTPPDEDDAPAEADATSQPAIADLDDTNSLTRVADRDDDEKPPVVASAAPDGDLDDDEIAF